MELSHMWVYIRNFENKNLHFRGILDKDKKLISSFYSKMQKGINVNQHSWGYYAFTEINILK